MKIRQALLSFVVMSDARSSCVQANRHANILSPKLVTPLKSISELVVQISLTNSIYWNAHTLALTDTGKLYAFGSGDKGQLGIKLPANQTERSRPERVNVDLN